MSLRVHGVNLELERRGHPWAKHIYEETEGINNQRKYKVESQRVVGPKRGRRGSTGRREMVVFLSPALVPKGLSVLLQKGLL